MRNLEVWQRGCRLAVSTYHLSRDCRDFGFRDQLTRSALSIPSNIAEGYERESNRERVRFLRISKGSCGEFWTQLLIGIEAGLIPKDQAQPLRTESAEIAKMLSGLIKHFEVRDEDGIPRYS
ncbi:four helix bundle protein [Thiohalocapsa halophila]|uniref:Four helix bundle protein n=1 Tax=Thiohalocapsa halophila TaxID=69359 RepID=A0ABS1CKB6_9GAMM|nr:four helix bundle protein [Thiohalocapsa halophila]